MEEEILFSENNIWVSNEGTKKEPKYYVWIDGLTHATADSAYQDFSLAKERARYLARTMSKKERLFINVD